MCDRDLRNKCFPKHSLQTVLVAWQSIESRLPCAQARWPPSPPEHWNTARVCVSCERALPMSSETSLQARPPTPGTAPAAGRVRTPAPRHSPCRWMGEAPSTAPATGRGRLSTHPAGGHPSKVCSFWFCCFYNLKVFDELGIHIVAKLTYFFSSIILFNFAFFCLKIVSIQFT